MTARTGVVALIGSGVEHRHVARALAEGPGLDAVVVVAPPGRPLWQRLRRARGRYGTRGMVERVLFGAAMRASGGERRRVRTLSAVLGDPVPPAGVPEHTVPEVNGPQAFQLLDRLAPECLCVYGTPIVRDATLATARRVALNLHTGISPRYRGADCAFWPLFHREPEYLGATVHVCTSDVDGGAVYATVTPRLEPDDGVAAVFARCVAAGAKLYAEVVSGVLAGTATPTPQDLREGTEFRAAMRDWRAELRVWRLLRRGLVRDFVAAGRRGDVGTRPER